MTDPEGQATFDRARIHAMLELLERMAAGDTTVHLPLSDNRDELDAIAHAVNVLSDELRWASTRMAEAERRRVAELLRGKDSGSRSAG
jgi:nitrate/nitrite-specific signal transduction histidine kinase